MSRYAFTLIAFAVFLSLSGCERSCRECECPAIKTRTAPGSFVKTELYFGLQRPNGKTVSDEEWRVFVDAEITPAFKEGLTVVDAYGQYLNQTGKLTKEGTKLVILIHEATPERTKALAAIIERYKKQFEQESVLRVTTPCEVEF